MYDFHGTSASELSFAAGDVIELITFDEGDGWWSGVLGTREGWFPSDYVSMALGSAPLASTSLEDPERRVSSQVVTECQPLPLPHPSALGSTGPLTLPRLTSSARRRVKRRHVVDELLRTEVVRLVFLVDVVVCDPSPAAPAPHRMFPNRRTVRVM
jgi:hypothetical protein